MALRKAVPILIVAIAALAVILGGGALAIYRATHATPKFYEQALARDPASQKQASEEFLQQATALASDVEQNDRWQIVFTAEQINGWLAVDVPENLPDVIPKEVRDPRVAISPGEATLACRYKGAKTRRRRLVLVRRVRKRPERNRAAFSPGQHRRSAGADQPGAQAGRTSGGEARLAIGLAAARWRPGGGDLA